MSRDGMPPLAPTSPTAGSANQVFRSAADVQQLWFATLHRRWSVLILVPAHAEGSCLRLAEALAQVGTQHRGAPVRVYNAENIQLGGASRVILDATAHDGGSSASIVAVSSPLVCPATIPIMLAADAALLCVELGRADAASAQRTVEMLGRQRFLGTVAVDSGPLK